MSTFASIVGAASHWLVPLAQAQGVACTLVPGGCAAENPLVAFGTSIASLFLYIAAGLCFLFVLYGGAQMLMSLGDEGKVTEGRTTIFYSLGGMALALASQSIVVYVMGVAKQARASENLILGTMEIIVDTAAGLFNIVFVLVVIFAGFKFVLARGNSGEFETARRMVIYAAIGAICINLARAIAESVFYLNL